MIGQRRKVRQGGHPEFLEEQIGCAVEDGLSWARCPSNFKDDTPSFKGPERVVRVDASNLSDLSSAHGLLVRNNSKCLERRCRESLGTVR